MNYKEIIYSNYVKGHTKNLYGDVTLTSIRKMFPAWRHYFSKVLPDDKNSKILDIGCGEGGFVYWLTSEGYNNTAGIDVSDQQIEVGKKLGINKIQSFDLFAFLNDSSEKYDLIIARDVIEHFTKNEVFTVLQLINKSLNENGVFIMQVPNGSGIFFGEVFYGDYTHEVPYTEWSISQIAYNNGFRKSVCYPVNPVPNNVFSALRLIFWKVAICLIKLLKFLETGNFKGIFTRNIIGVLHK